MAAGGEPVDLNEPTTQGPLRPDGATTDFILDTCGAPSQEVGHRYKSGLAILGHQPMHHLADNLLSLVKNMECRSALAEANPRTELWWTHSEHSGLSVEPIARGSSGVLSTTYLADSTLDSLMRSNPAQVILATEQEPGNPGLLEAPTLEGVLKCIGPKHTTRYLQICCYIKGVGVEATPFTNAADGGANTKRHKGEHIWSQQ